LSPTWTTTATGPVHHNGIYHRPNDLDYLAYVGTPSYRLPLRDGMGRAAPDPDSGKMPRIPIANYAYRNNGDLTFTNQAQAWGLRTSGFLERRGLPGLEQQGAPDLVVNRLEAPAAILSQPRRSSPKSTTCRSS